MATFIEEYGRKECHMEEEFSSGKTATFTLAITSRVVVKAKGKRTICGFLFQVRYIG